MTAYQTMSTKNFVTDLPYILYFFLTIVTILLILIQRGIETFLMQFQYWVKFLHYAHPTVLFLFKVLIHYKVNKIANERNLLPSDQQAFRKRHSTLHSLLKFTTHVTEGLKKISIISCFMDTEKPLEPVWINGRIFQHSHTSLRPGHKADVMNSFQRRSNEKSSDGYLAQYVRRDDVKLERCTVYTKTSTSSNGLNSANSDELDLLQI